MLAATVEAQLIGESPAVSDLRADIERTARSDAKVLITGESGVGKELVARSVHAHSARAARPFVAVNCAGLPETLLESELFGHVKGSFTGAYRDKQGKLEMADGGTLFLDEVGEMTLRMQGLLLRFLETGELQKVGAERARAAVNIRVIAATNRNLRELIAQQAFREDLFYRLNVIHLLVPPLRERRTDIPDLVQRFLVRSTSTGHYALRSVSTEAMDALCKYLLAGQRAGTPEPGGAAGRHLPARGGRARGSAAGNPPAAVWRLPAAPGTPPHRLRRALPEADRHR